MFDKLLSKLFNTDRYDFNEVHVCNEVIDSIMEYAIESDPYEFMCLFEGKIKNKILKITGLIFLPSQTSEEGAVIQTGMLPVIMDRWGSVHSHPGPSALPSGADFLTFTKMGLFHMIICRPYTVDNIMAYNRYGEVTTYKII
jgi:proteasome lid subunit RPN8/RPN11